MLEGVSAPTIQRDDPEPIPAEPAVGFSGIWYQITGGGGTAFANKYGGGLCTYPQQINPNAVYAPEAERTFFAYSHDPGDGSIRHAVSFYDHATGEVARPRYWLDKKTGDAHDAPALAIDGAGHVHLFASTHGNHRRAYIRRGAEPFDIDAFTELMTEDNASAVSVFDDELRFNYGSPWYLPNAPGAEKIFLPHTRYEGRHRHLFTTSSADGKTWTRRRGFSHIEGGQYQVSQAAPDGRTMGTMFNYHPKSDTSDPCDARTNLYYAATSDLGGTWTAADGSVLIDNTGEADHPFTHIENGALAYRAEPGERVYLKDLAFDEAGAPVLMFLTSRGSETGPQSGPRRLRTAQWNGTAWVIRDVLTTTHNYDYGSLYIEAGAWRLIGPYLPGPQEHGTGGEIGLWVSRDEGATWSLEKEMTRGSACNHTYVRRPQHARPDFYGLWADGHAFEPSPVRLYLCNRAGDVFRLPEAFPDGVDRLPVKRVA